MDQVNREIDLAARLQSSKSYLYTSVIQDFLGYDASVVVSKLLSCDRLSVRDLVLKTKLTSKKVKNILLTLVQLRCVDYFLSDAKAVFYFLNEEGLLLLVYSGEILTLIKLRYDEDQYPQIIQAFLKYGNLTLQDYVNSVDDGDSDVERKFVELIDEGFLVPIQGPVEFQQKYELYHQLYQKNYRQFPKGQTISEIKKKREVKLQTEKEYNELFQVKYQDIFVSNGNATLNQFNSYKVNSKVDLRLKHIKSTVLFKISLNRVLKSLRTTSLAKFASQRLGSITGKIFEKILRRVEKNSPDCGMYSLYYSDKYITVNSYLEEPGASELLTRSAPQYSKYTKDIEADVKLCTTLYEMSKHLAGINIEHSISFSSKRKLSNGNGLGHVDKKVKLENGVSLDVEVVEDDDDEEENSSLKILRQHFELMVNNTIPFLLLKANGSYYVPFADLTKQLKSFTYLYMIKSVFGLNEFKVLNCIINGKLIDEKTLINLTLLQENLLRMAVNRLFKIQAIEIQEIPKTLDRQANRSAFAYRLNTKNSLSLIEANLVNEMATLYTSIRDLKVKNKLLLSKVKREDIKGREAELLLSNELNQLKWINEKELNCIGRVQRTRSLWEVFAIY